MTDMEFSVATKEQIANPQHVFIQIEPGKYLRHGTTVDDGCEIPAYAGEPMRFTKLAAECFVKDWPNANLVVETRKVCPKLNETHLADTIAE